MIRPGIVWCVARTELRLTRRLVRYWIFMILSGLLGLAVYGWYSILHYQFSSYSATAAVVNPRYLMGFMGFWWLLFFAVGLVFLGFDVRARDVRDRIWEVVDALPMSNIEYVFGKYLGILIPSWIPVVLITGGILTLGLIFNERIEPLSVLTFTVVQTLPAFTFALGLVFLVTLLLRNRGIAAVALIVLLIAIVAIGLFVPSWLTPLTDITGAFTVPFPSDMIGTIVDQWGALQRSGVLLLGIGMLVLAAGVHPRNDHGSRQKRLLVGLGIVLLAAALLLTIVMIFSGTLGDYYRYKEVHAARADEPSPDLVAIAGSVSIRPGRELALELDTRFRAPQSASLDTALFALNPGLSVDRITGPSGAELSFTHEDALVDVELPQALAPGSETELHWSISGEPDVFYGYIDGEGHLFETQAMDGNVFMLGYENSIFKRAFVALPGGARWLPAGGTDVGRDDPRTRPTDFYDVDLTVEVPEGWLVAGPGRRLDEPSGEGGRARFRFRPGAPVPSPALVAGAYASRSIEVGDILAEVLIHESHAENLEVFADSVEAIRDWLTERLDQAAAVGLSYPYDGITMVEVPMALRSYGGGWRKASVMGPPGMLWVRESSLPTARFDVKFDDPDEYRDHEGGIGRAKLEALEQFFENDFNGGNPFTELSKSFFQHQAAASGDAGIPLEFVNEELTARLVSERGGYFSAYMFDRNINSYINDSIGNYFATRGRRDSSFADTMIESVTSGVEIWDQVLGVALTEMDPWEDPPRTLNVLTLKGGEMSRSLLDGHGREATGKLLGALRERARGGTYDRDDLIEAGREVGLELEDWLDIWVDETDLPGFVVEPARLYRASDDEEGAPRYVTRFTVRNDENVPGLARLSYGVGAEPDAFAAGEIQHTDPVTIPARSAVEFGLVTSDPPRFVQLDPYLSLNRQPFDVRLPSLDEDEIVEEEPWEGHRAADWSPPENGWIVVDDLSEGFGIEEDGEKKSLRLGSREDDGEADQGLPVVKFDQPPFGKPPGQWSRRSTYDAYGKYRHTYAVRKKGKGTTRAVFTADVPRAGAWDLELYLPVVSRGTWNLVVEDPSGGKQDVAFETEGAQTGWNALGSFEIDGGEVRVVLSDETDGRAVVADAIRWIPPRGSAAER
jgi:ABC-type transport system involved in multi-copper enzyme maturation permease subunit